MLLEWSQAQIPAHEAVARAGVSQLLADARGPSGEAGAVAPGWPVAKAEHQVPLDDVIVFNRSHLKVFGSDPAYRDIFTYINSFGPEPVHAEEIASALGIERDRAAEMLGQLHELGVIVEEAAEGTAKTYRASKRNFYFPDDGDFFELRNSNMVHNSSSILGRLRHEDLMARRAYRGVVTRELTEEQVRLLIEGVEGLMSGFVAMPETPSPRTIYSLCVLFGERFSKETNYARVEHE
jgi:hypothetical protein